MKEDAKAGPAVIAAPEARPVRTAGQVRAEWDRALRDLKQIMPDSAELLDASKRQVLAPQVLPVLKTMSALLPEMAAGKPQFPGEVANDTIRVQACLAYLGDADTIKKLQSLAADTDNPASLHAHLAQELAAWWQAAHDEKAQEKTLGEMQKLATATPANGRLFFVLMTMRDIGAASPDLADRAEAIVANTLTGGDAPFIKDIHAGHILQRATMNNPVEFAGPTVDGKDFSTTQYKGKVVLIDFWATWCHPCVAEIPRIKALYAKYHDQGLEVVGVSCDPDGAKLADYVKKNDMPWVQMWDKKAQVNDNDDSWHPIAKKWGILSIPAMFLIDRNGCLRTVEARANMEEMIPKLLAEKPSEKTPATPVQ